MMEFDFASRFMWHQYGETSVGLFDAFLALLFVARGSIDCATFRGEVNGRLQPDTSTTSGSSQLESAPTWFTEHSITQ